MAKKAAEVEEPIPELVQIDLSIATEGSAVEIGDEIAIQIRGALKADGTLDGVSTSIENISEVARREDEERQKEKKKDA